MDLVILILLNVLFLVIIYVVLHNQIRSHLKNNASMEDVKKETGAILTEINEATERNVLIIEDAIQKARALQSQIEKSMSLYKKELDKPQTYNHLKKNPLQNAKSTIRSMELNFDSESGSQANASSENSSPVSFTPTAAAGQVTEADNDGKPSVDVNSRIVSLYRSGVSIEDIASKHSKTTSEVELIISLYGNS